MVLRDSITKAKRLFQKTFHSFKSMLSGGYQRLPKTSPFQPFSCTGRRSHLFHSFRDQLEDFCRNDFDAQPTNLENHKLISNNIMNFQTAERGVPQHSGTQINFVENHKRQKSKADDQSDFVHDQRRQKYGRQANYLSSSSSINRRNEACSAVTQKLKELELIDVSNVDHLLDIDEVLHYYSRITCPFYVDVVNKFFMDMYDEFLPLASSASRASRW